MNKYIPHPLPVFCILISMFYLLTFSGCTAFQTAGVKGSPSADGPYAGFRQQANRTDGINSWSNYIDLGSGWIEGDSPYAPDGSFFHMSTSIPLHEDDLVRFGMDTGKTLYFGGFNIYGRGEQRYEEIYISANYKANFTLSKFLGDTEQNVNVDISAEMPPYMGGLRFSWFEGGRSFSILTGTRWVPAEKDQLEFEFGIDLGWDYIYTRESYRPDVTAGISMRYYFNSQKPKRDKRK